MFKFFLLFTLVPLGELWLLIEVGKVIGTWPTILLVASTGFFGVMLAKSQGLSTLRRIGADLEQGDLPGDQLFDGAFILVGGAFLLTPGLLTDALGFALLLPFTRNFIKRHVQHYLQRKMDNGTLYIFRR